MIDEKEFIKMVRQIASNSEVNAPRLNKEYIEDFISLICKQDDIDIDDATHALVGCGALYMKVYEKFRQGKGYEGNKDKTTKAEVLASTVYEALFKEDNPVMPADALAALVISLYHVYGMIEKQKAMAHKPAEPEGSMYA